MCYFSWDEHGNNEMPAMTTLITTKVMAGGIYVDRWESNKKGDNSTLEGSVYGILYVAHCLINLSTACGPTRSTGTCKRWSLHVHVPVFLLLFN